MYTKRCPLEAVSMEWQEIHLMTQMLWTIIPWLFSSIAPCVLLDDPARRCIYQAVQVTSQFDEDAPFCLLTFIYIYIPLTHD